MEVWIAAAGAVVGLCYGLFGVGSAFATPILSTLGVPGMAAVVGPLPGLLPGSAAGAWSHSRNGTVDWSIARRAMVGALPLAFVGAATSQLVPDLVLLMLSGVVLALVGLRVLWPGQPLDPQRALARRESLPFVIGTAAVVGFVAGLLANGGGFLLVPLFLLALGFDMKEAAGTSLVVAVGVTVPTLLSHTLLGDIDWAVAGWFSLGIVPGAFLGGQLGELFPAHRLRNGFGAILVGFAVWYLARQALVWI